MTGVLEQLKQKLYFPQLSEGKSSDDAIYFKSTPYWVELKILITRHQMLQSYFQIKKHFVQVRTEVVI